MTTSFPHFFVQPYKIQTCSWYPIILFLHMEREAIINMEQVSESGPHQPVVQPMVAPVITTNSFIEISNSVPSVATARPSLIDTCRPSGLSFFLNQVNPALVWVFSNQVQVNMALVWVFPNLVEA